jgi:hypothetical protein
MSIYRAPHPDRDFTIIGNGAMRDSRLRNADLGLLVRMLSLPPWESTSVEELAKGAPDGESAIRSTLRRLTAAGYVRREKIRTAKGRFETLTFVYDSPVAVESPVDKAEQRRADVNAGGTEPIPGLDITAGQVQERKSTLDLTSGNGASLQVRSSVEKPHVDEPQVVEPEGGPPPGYISTSPRTTSMEGRGAGSPVDDLAMAVMDGLSEINRELRGQVHRPGVASACYRLAESGWSPDDLRAWVLHERWHAAGPGAVITRLRSLGPPPAPPPAAPGCEQCAAGWLGEDELGRPKPCPTCRPARAVAS